MPLSWGLTMLVLCGLVILARRRLWLIPVYMAMSIALFAIWPAAGQSHAIRRVPRGLTPQWRCSIVIDSAWRRAGRAEGDATAVASAGSRAAVSSWGSSRRRSTRCARASACSTIPPPWVDAEAGAPAPIPLLAYDRPWRLHGEALEWLRQHGRPDEIVATSSPHWAYLKTGLKTVSPPWEEDPVIAQRLLEAVPVDYLVIDNVPGQRECRGGPPLSPSRSCRPSRTSGS